MCKPTDLSARRRHRPTYLAPSPILIANDEIPAENAVDVESAATTTQEGQETPQESIPSSSSTLTSSESSPNACAKHRSTIWSFIRYIYHGIMDVALVIFVILMSFFIYDVDVSIVKDEGDRDTSAASSQESWGTSGRVVVRNEEDGQQSLRTRMASANLV